MEYPRYTVFIHEASISIPSTTCSFETESEVKAYINMKVKDTQKWFVNLVRFPGDTGLSVHSGQGPTA